ncbi:MAG: cysteine--tRNA ligase [bacterium]
MRNIVLTNSLTRRKEPLALLNPNSKHVGIYACGVTVYDDCHIGHAMQAIYFDILRSYLKYCGYNVTYVRNYTDVDDKIINRAREKGISPAKLAAEMIDGSIRDMAAIGVTPADFEPKVSENIPEIIAMIEQLIANGYAYPTKSGDVYYRVRKKSDYGKLSNRKPDEMKSGTRDIVAGEKEDELDFALWKNDSTPDASWQSPWGLGRPGWHIECSAMSCKHLGKSFEIHGGGRDLIFPHHENEIAQSEAANGAQYASIWMHSGLLTIDQQKMSKSLGNHITIKKFLSEWPAEVLRLGFLMNHYSSNIDFSQHFFQTCMKRLLYYYEGLVAMSEYSGDLKAEPDPKLIDEFNAAMADDLNTVSAISAINLAFKRARELMAGKKNPQKQKDVAAISSAIRQTADVLGLFKTSPETEIHSLKTKILPSLGITESEIKGAITQRQDARAAKDFAKGDAVRDQMAAKGIELRDSPAGTIWSIKFVGDE